MTKRMNTSIMGNNGHDDFSVSVVVVEGVVEVEVVGEEVVMDGMVEKGSSRIPLL